MPIPMQREEPKDRGAPAIPDVEAALATFPDFPLDPSTPYGAAFLAHGAATFHQAAYLLRRLPYGRNTDRADPALVLPEGRGTCSTKHALLAHLAAEHGVAVDLVVGIYEMTEANTPGVGPTLARHNIASLPEAHCYLRIGAVRLDVTRPAVEGAEPIERFLSEHVIAPEGIGAPKLALHHAAMERWVRERMPGWTVDDAWRVREACIAALGQDIGAA
ncbi:MAG TPA: hypothetical protein VFH27_09960 [Longimicrobiaceae bacterium]|nr:hypothetical protein [Longimicrobiaceae bacterium]